MHDIVRIAELLRARPPFEDAGGVDREAAVSAVLRRSPSDGGAEILFVRRAEHPDDPWSGHMAFPGGRRDAGDTSLLATAVRETREELGLDLLAHGELLTRLPDVAAIARGQRLGLRIAPFVFALDASESVLSPNDEIAEALWAPLAPIARGEGAGTLDVAYGGQTYVLPCVHVRGRTVWGLTFQMLQSLLFALRPP